MRLTFLSMLLVTASLIACGGGDKKETPSQPDSSTPIDAGKDAASPDKDAASPDKDAASPDKDAAPRDCNLEATPGNDCDDAVGCRGALECGLDAKSCCVAGLNVSAVMCSDGLSCPPNFGRANCDGPEDCGGRACCVDIVAGKTECSDSCDGQVALCHSDDDCIEGMSCSQGKTFSWWGVCG